MRACKVCNSQFIPKDKNNNYCSLYCLSIKRIPIKKRGNCLNCSSVYRKQQPRQKYCCTKCRIVHHKKIKTTLQKYLKRCKICKNSFKTRYSNKKYCSYECSRDRKKKRNQTKYNRERYKK